MTTSQPLWHQMVKTAVMQRPEAVLEVTLELWEQLAKKLVSIIGEGGFQSLYSRSFHLTSTAFPWIIPNHLSQQDSARFADLKMRFEERSITETSEASCALLITFIDLLALLIGELLTVGIIRSAWGDNNWNNAAKETE